MWQKEGEGPGSWRAARPAPLPQQAPRPQRGAAAGAGPWVRGQNARPGTGAPAPGLLQPLPSRSPVSSLLCAHRLPRLYWGSGTR